MDRNRYWCKGCLGFTTKDYCILHGDLRTTFNVERGDNPMHATSGGGTAETAVARLPRQSTGDT